MRTPASSFVATRTWMATDACGNSSTCSQSVTVEGVPAITADITNQTVCAGAAVTWSVGAAGIGLSYQWQRDGTNLVEGVGNFTGTTSATLTNSGVGLEDALEAGRGYVCVVSGSCTPAASSSKVSLTVDPVPVGGTATAGTSQVCSGSTTTIGLSGQAGTIVGWQSSTDGGNSCGGSGFNRQPAGDGTADDGDGVPGGGAKRDLCVGHVDRGHGDDRHPACDYH